MTNPNMRAECCLDTLLCGDGVIITQLTHLVDFDDFFYSETFVVP